MLIVKAVSHRPQDAGRPMIVAAIERRVVDICAAERVHHEECRGHQWCARAEPPRRGHAAAGEQRDEHV